MKTVEISYFYYRENSKMDSRYCCLMQNSRVLSVCQMLSEHSSDKVKGIF